jgi:Mce-associated membrane protein
MTATPEPAAAPQPAAAKPKAARRVAVPWLLAALAVCVAILFASLWAPLYLAARDRDAVHEVATQLVLHLTTFEGERIDEWVAQTQAMATGDYAEQVNQLFDENLRQALAQVRARSTGRLLHLFVQDLDGGRAEVFAVVRQTVANSASPGGTEDELRIQVELLRIDGSWLASNVEILTPGGGLPGAPSERQEVAE